MILAMALVFVPAVAMGDQLVYEREYSQVAGPHNKLQIKLDVDDKLTVQRPGFMTHSGVYTARLPAGTYVGMRAALERLDIDSARLHADVQQRAAEELLHVSDAEYSYFYALDGEREVTLAFAVQSLASWAGRFEDDVRLQRLRSLETQWFDLMDQALAGDGG